MRTWLKAVSAATCVAVCLAGLTAGAAEELKAAITPTPKSITYGKGNMQLTPTSRIVVTDPRLDKHAPVVAEEIWLLTGMKLKIVKGEGGKGDIILKINPKIQADKELLAAQNVKLVRTRDMAHTISVTDRAVVAGWDFRAACEGTATLIQSIAGKKGKYYIRQMEVKDWPHAGYTGTMVDAGRQWIPADALKALAVSCRMFKVRYLRLHFSDDQGYGMPSKAFPKLGTQNQDCMGGFGVKRWTWEEMEDLEAFAAARGVSVVPELETPGHHSAMGRCYRDVFHGPGCMDMASEELYKGLETVVDEVCSIFKTTPYFSIGCDEANWNGVGAGPMALVYKRRHAVPMDPHPIRNAWEIYVVHMLRMSKMLKERGKLTLAWENFPNDRRLKDHIIPFIWYPHAVAHQYQQQGFTTITVPWSLGVPFEKWNIYHCNGSTLARTDRVLGAGRPMWQMSRLCIVNGWMQNLSARQERTWGPDTPIEMKEFNARQAAARTRATRLATPVKVELAGKMGVALGQDHMLAGRDIFGSAGDVTVTLSALPSEGKIHYTTNFTDPTPQSPVYTKPITFKNNFVLNAALFLDGRQVGCASRHEYILKDIIGYVPAGDWLIAGPYTEAGKSGAQLFDVEFPPEKGGDAKWIRGEPAGLPWMIALSYIPGYGGDNRVAYMRCKFWSPKAQRGLVYVGSDDGIKVFVNGKFVHGVNRGRGVAEEDQIGVDMKEGWNDLLLKVVNFGGHWAAKGRIRAANGGRLEGLRIKAE